jgi:hypothetical protein
VAARALTRPREGKGGWTAHGFSGLRLRTSRARDATRSPTAMRGNRSTEDEPGYRQLLHGPSSPRRVYAFLCGLFQPGEVAMK